MIGNRLEVDSLIIDVFDPAIKNLNKCVESVGGNVSGLIFSPLASARSVLSKSKRSGVVLVDIGSSTTASVFMKKTNLFMRPFFLSVQAM